MTGLNLPKPFDGVEHSSFRWQEGDHAALLLHGFPGTPAEMRPLGTVLRDAGWTVHGLMLPGLGADFASLEERKFQDWSDAATHAMVELKRQHSVVILVGYSMGGALALHTAAEQRPAGLVLMAPFWTLGEGSFRLLWPVIKLLFRRVKPLKRADFSAIEVRSGLQRMFAGIDLDDPKTLQALRQITISLGPIEQLRKLGNRAISRASILTVPTLVIQGTRDRVVPPARTKLLVSRFANPPEYLEVRAGHDIIDPGSGAWGEVKAGLQSFAQTIQDQGENPSGL
ncbi:MAG: alpha/beta fold hydrolase [Candidatus Binatia bacterium]